MATALRTNVPANPKSVPDFHGLPIDFGDAYTGTAVTASRFDLKRIVRMSSGSANTFTIPPEADWVGGIEDGEAIILMQYGAGQTTVVAGTGVTLRSLDAALAISGQYGSVAIIKMDTNEWWVKGDLA